MEKDFDRWNKKKKTLHQTDFTDFVHEREVWWCALGANVGVEADGKHDNFERPVLVPSKIQSRRGACRAAYVAAEAKSVSRTIPTRRRNVLRSRLADQAREHQTLAEKAVPDG
jgi:hypothetical protein